MGKPDARRRLTLTLTLFAALAFATDRCRGLPTATQLRSVIRSMLRDDLLWRDVLTERIRLNRDDLPAAVRDAAPDAYVSGEPVDPLVALHRLIGGGGDDDEDRYAGDELALSAVVVDTALTCLTYKRVAVHIALTVRMMALESEQRKTVVRANVFAHMLPRNMDALSAVEKRYLELLDVYGRVAPIASREAERFEAERYETGLLDGLASLNAIIGRSCADSDMKDYFDALRLPTAVGRRERGAGPIIADGHRVADDVELATVVELLRENENAVLDLYDEMYLLRNLGMGIWKSVLKYPELPDDPEDFRRTSPPGYRETMVKILERRKRAAGDG